MGRNERLKIIILPFLALITLDTASGILPPIARNVIPITASLILNVSPEKVEVQTCLRESQ